MTTVACGGRPGANPQIASKPQPPQLGSGASATAFQPQVSVAETNTAAQAQSTSPLAQTASGSTKTTAVSGGTGIVKPHSVYLRWAQSKSSVIGYYIYRALSAGGPFTRLNRSLEPATVYSDTGVIAGKVYFYAITASNTEGESAYSNIVRAVIPTP